MSTYIIYNNNTGEILNVHREYLQGSTETLELGDDEILSQIKGLIPAQVKIGILGIKKELELERGYSFYVDVKNKKLIKIKSPPVSIKKTKVTTKTSIRKKAGKKKSGKKKTAKRRSSK